MEINLSFLEDRPEEMKEKFPDINERYGITYVFGIYSDHVTFLGFKCRSGKIYLLENLKETFLFDVISSRF